MQKRLLLPFLSLLVTPLYAGEILEVDIHGMTCAFCVDAIQRNLSQLPEVERAEVSLKHKVVRVYVREDQDHIDRDQIRQVILDAGFTPLAIRTLTDEN